MVSFSNKTGYTSSMEITKTKRQIIEYCLSFENVYEDYPFDETWTVMRHGDSRKCFAFIFEREGNVWINLKCDPEWRDMWTRAHVSIVPAYHMNKTHWLSVILDGTVPGDVVKELVETSYALTANAVPTIMKTSATR